MDGRRFLRVRNGVRGNLKSAAAFRSVVILQTCPCVPPPISETCQCPRLFAVAGRCGSPAPTHPASATNARGCSSIHTHATARRSATSPGAGIADIADDPCHPGSTAIDCYPRCTTCRGMPGHSRRGGRVMRTTIALTDWRRQAAVTASSRQFTTRLKVGNCP